MECQNYVLLKGTVTSLIKEEDGRIFLVISTAFGVPNGFLTKIHLPVVCEMGKAGEIQESSEITVRGHLQNNGRQIFVYADDLEINKH